MGGHQLLAVMAAILWMHEMTIDRPVAVKLAYDRLSGPRLSVPPSAHNRHKPGQT